MKKRAEFMSDFVAKQYPLDKYRSLIVIFLDMVTNYLIINENDYRYDTPISSYEEKYSKFIPSNNLQLLDLCIKGDNVKDKEKYLLGILFSSYNFLNNEEREMFKATFFEKLSDAEIIKKYNTYSNKICIVRKSAVIKFCLKSGLYKHVDIVK